MEINLNLLVPHPAFLCLYLASSVSDPNDGCCNGERMESSAKHVSAALETAGRTERLRD